MHLWCFTPWRCLHTPREYGHWVHQKHIAFLIGYKITWHFSNQNSSFFLYFLFLFLFFTSSTCARNILENAGSLKRICHQPIYLPDIVCLFFLFFPPTICFDCLYSCAFLFSCCFCLFLCFLLVFVVVVSVSHLLLVKLFVRYIFLFLFFQLYVNELTAYKQQACWWAHDHSLYLYFIANKFLFKPKSWVTYNDKVRGHFLHFLKTRLTMQLNDLVAIGVGAMTLFVDFSDKTNDVNRTERRSSSLDSPFPKKPNSSNHCAATVGCDGKEGFHWQEAAGLLSGLGCHVRAAPATNTSARWRRKQP